VKEILAFKAKGRDVMKGGEGYDLREDAAPYTALLSREKGDIRPENTDFWEIDSE